MKTIEPIDILLVTFNRLEFLKKTVKSIYERTRYPHRLWVIDNASTDGTIDWLKKAKLHGYLHDYIVMTENLGLAAGYTEGFKKVTSKYFVTTQDDIVVCDLTPCWLERELHLIKKYPEYGGLSMRIERIRHRDVDEFKELIESPTSLASVYRIQRKDDIEKIGGFGLRKHWESTSYMNRMKPLKKKLAVITRLYASHIGFMSENKGFKKDFTNYHTYSLERVNQGEDQPYPDIDSKTNIPININTNRDSGEQNKREEYYKYWGVDFRIKSTKRVTEEQKELAKYCEKGIGLDIGCGAKKCHSNCIGVDLHHDSVAEVKTDCRDLWMFKNDELDFVVSSHTLEHMPDAIEVLKEWKRILKPGGKLCVAVPNGYKYPKFILKNGHKQNFSDEQLRLIFKFILKMKVVKLNLVSNNKGIDRVILIVGVKK